MLLIQSPLLRKRGSNKPPNLRVKFMYQCGTYWDTQYHVSLCRSQSEVDPVVLQGVEKTWYLCAYKDLRVKKNPHADPTFEKKADSDPTHEKKHDQNSPSYLFFDKKNIIDIYKYIYILLIWSIHIQFDFRGILDLDVQTRSGSDLKK